MKNKLFYQDIFTGVISVVLTLMILICSSAFLTAFLDIPIKNGAMAQNSIVIKDNRILYSDRDFSAVDEQKLFISIKNREELLTLSGIKYSIDETQMKDGARLISLTPYINTSLLYEFTALFTILIFLSCYTFCVYILGKYRQREIIKPILSLKRNAEKMADGCFDINIEECGLDETKQLALSLESLRLRLKDEIYMGKKTDENRKFLISSISHDLRTPVTAVKGYIEGILDGVANTDEKRRAYLNAALEKTELINTMISDLLLYSKLDLNQIEFKYQTVDILKYISNFYEENCVIAQCKNRKLEFSYELKNSCLVLIDTSQFDRVLGNVFENAIKFTHDNVGIIRIFMRETNASVIIEINDNGCGIANDDLQHIFERFYRGEKSRSSMGSSGLGLAISKQIIENMGGRIWASSKQNVDTSIMISLKKVNGEDYEQNINN